MPHDKDITSYSFFKRLTQLPFVDAIYLYGSRARGSNFSRSDIDLAISCPDATPEQWLEILKLIELERVDTLLQIDVTRYDTLEESRFRNRLETDKQILYQKEKKMQEEWKDALEDLGRALDRFREILDEPTDKNSYVIDAAIQRFEFTVELFWKTLKRMLSVIAGEDAPFPKLVLESAYRLEWIHEEELWLLALKDRNLSAHIYDEARCVEIYHRLATHYQLMRRAYTQLRARFYPET